VIKIPQQPSPVGLAFALAAQKSQQVRQFHRAFLPRPGPNYPADGHVLHFVRLAQYKLMALICR